MSSKEPQSDKKEQILEIFSLKVQRLLSQCLLCLFRRKGEKRKSSQRCLTICHWTIIPQEELHAHSYVLRAELWLQCAYTYMNTSERICHPFLGKIIFEQMQMHICEVIPGWSLQFQCECTYDQNSPGGRHILTSVWTEYVLTSQIIAECEGQEGDGWWRLIACLSLCICSLNQRFGQGVGRRGLAINKPRKYTQHGSSEWCPLSSIGGVGLAKTPRPPTPIRYFWRKEAFSDSILLPRKCYLMCDRERRRLGSETSFAGGSHRGSMHKGCQSCDAAFSTRVILHPCFRTAKLIAQKRSCSPEQQKNLAHISTESSSMMIFVYCFLDVLNFQCF